MPRARSAAPSPLAPLTGHLALQTPLGAVLSDSRIRLLEAIDRCGSLNRAAREVPLSYKAAWDALDSMNQLSPEPLVLRSTGGAGGGGTRLTEHARQLIALYRAMESSQQDLLNRLPGQAQGHLPAGDAPALRSLIRRLSMRSSARNQFAARVVSLADPGGRTDVLLDLLAPEGSDPNLACERITATITPESARSMGLRAGSEVHALIKAPWVDVQARAPRAPGDRNRLAGVVAELRPGPTHWGVSLRLPSGLLLEANVPSARAQQLAIGQPAWGLFDRDSAILVSFA